jgi:hypothetical protein
METRTRISKKVARTITEHNRTITRTKDRMNKNKMTKQVKMNYAAQH